MKHTPNSIKKKIARLFRSAEVNSPPVDVARIAEILGVEIVEDELDDDMSGFLVVSGGAGKIGVNRQHHPNRKRFTIAHELGHFVLHASGTDETLFVDKKIFNRNQEASEGVYKEEIEANRFAAELLMPERMVLDICEHEAMDIDLADDLLICNLSRRFQVSQQALTYRLVSLELLPPI